MSKVSSAAAVRIVVIGLGVQGRKRRQLVQSSVVATIDPHVAEADYRTIEQVPLDSYDAAFVCTPDGAKLDLLTYLLGHGKHVLVEKPLLAEPEQFARLESFRRKSNSVCYTAYNHRFEPHYQRMQALIASAVLGRIYRCRMFYGNGTARLVRNSMWRDEGAGVIPDLGSHLLDTARFWFGDLEHEVRLSSVSRFENRAPDHAVISLRGAPEIELEMSLLSWRNHFTADVIAENGSAHITSLCKWGPTTFTHRQRVLPSGVPPEESVTLVQSDPTWTAEHDHFFSLCANNADGNLVNDMWLAPILKRLGSAAIEGGHV